MSHSKNIYEKILKLPLFQGMSKSELTQVLTQTKFEFISLAKGKTIIYEGDNCTHLYFLLDGSICMITTPDDHRFNIIENIYAPDILQPEHFFGMTQRYDSTFTSHTDSQLLRIHKNDVNAIIATCWQHKASGRSTIYGAPYPRTPIRRLYVFLRTIAEDLLEKKSST